MYFVPRGPASVSCLCSTASPRVSWWDLDPFVFAAHSVRLSWLCTTYALDHRRHRWWVTKMRSQLLCTIQVTSMTGIWRSPGLHRFSEPGHREVYPQQQRGLHANTAHALTQLKISAWCCAGEVPPCREAKSSSITTAFLIWAASRPAGSASSLWKTTQASSAT